MSWHRDEAGFAQRMVVTIAADGTRLDAHGTMSHDGGPWEHLSSPMSASTRRAAG